MSKLFVCIGNKAEKPYSVLTESLRVYTIEELCYYICDRADVLDHSFMQEALVSFIETQLGLQELAERLKGLVGVSLYGFCKEILEYASYPEEEERLKILLRMKENEQLPIIERLKKQGDVFVHERRYYKAQKAYRSLLRRSEVQQDEILKAEIYECLGGVAAHMFQYETAAYCYDKSCVFNERKEVRKKYLLCMRLMMSKEQYHEWIAGREEYYELSVDVERDFESARQNAEFITEHQSKRNLGAMREEYCQMVLE